MKRGAQSKSCKSCPLARNQNGDGWRRLGCATLARKCGDLPRSPLILERGPRFGDTSKSGVGNVEGKGKGRVSGVVGGKMVAGGDVL